MMPRFFTEVLKNRGETDDSIYDWNQLNNGKGWEAGPSNFGSSGHESRGHRGGRERERAERHAQRAAAAAAAAAAQSGSGSGAATSTQAERNAKVGRLPSATATPQPAASAMAVKGVTPPTAGNQAGNKANRLSSSGHPYASASALGEGSGAFEDRGEGEYGSGSNGYRTNGAMQSPAGGAGATGAGLSGAGAQDYTNDDDHQRGGFSLVKFLTCRCG